MAKLVLLQEVQNCRQWLQLTCHGPGRSRKTPSADPCSSCGKPSSSMLRCLVVMTSPIPAAMSSAEVVILRCQLRTQCALTQFGCKVKCLVDSHKGLSCQLQADRCAVRVLIDSLHALCYSSNALWRQSQRTLTLKYWCVVSLRSLTLCMLPAYK